MKKTTALLSAILLTATATLADYGYIRLAPPPPDNTPVVIKPAAIGTAKVVAIEALGGVTNKTVVLEAITANGAATNELITITLDAPTGKRKLLDLSSSPFWLLEGERLKRTGTDTNALVRIIFQN